MCFVTTDGRIFTYASPPRKMHRRHALTPHVAGTKMQGLSACNSRGRVLLHSNFLFFVCGHLLAAAVPRAPSYHTGGEDHPTIPVEEAHVHHHGGQLSPHGRGQGPQAEPEGKVPSSTSLTHTVSHSYSLSLIQSLTHIVSHSYSLSLI